MFSAAWRRRARCLAAIGAAALSLALASAAAADPGPKFNPPKQTYLALGDSLTFGYQQARVIAGLPNPDPASFNTGFVDDFAAGMAAINPNQQVANLGCPGATTDTAVGNYGCPTYPFALHTDYSGETQLQKALDVIAANPGQVSPITLYLGNNDLLHLIGGCQNNVLCIEEAFPGTLQHILGNLSTMLGQLRAAAPDAEIILFGTYDPNVLLLGPGDALLSVYNSAIAQLAAQQRARYANPFPAINGAIPGNELAAVCTFTNVCGPLHDIHPTDAGYANIAQVAFDASGYAKLLP